MLTLISWLLSKSAVEFIMHDRNQSLRKFFCWLIFRQIDKKLLACNCMKNSANFYTRKKTWKSTSTWPNDISNMKSLVEHWNQLLFVFDTPKRKKKKSWKAIFWNMKYKWNFTLIGSTASRHKIGWSLLLLIGMIWR